MTFLELSLSGGVFVLAIAALRGLTLRRMPKGTFVALWWLAAARLLLPVELCSRFSVYTLLASLRPREAAPEIPVPQGVPVIPAPPASPAPPPVQVIPGGPAAVPPAPFPVWTALWLGVGGLLALVFLVRYVRWRRRFREALPADCPGAETWFRFRRRVRLRVSDRIGAPLTYGLLRPVILLPKALDLSDEEALTCVLAHETVHIRYLDGLLKLALTAALCVHWFNPAAWLLYVLGNRDMELRCDEAAVLALGEDSRERYALALIRLAERQCVPLCGFAHRSGMEERIKAIMSVKRKSLLACFIALALVLGITTAFATSAKPPEAEGPNYEDIVDGELLARSSAESAAQWDETLAPYAPFGLDWSFDDPDLDGNGLTMTWEGHEVRGIYDQERGVWITEHTGISTYGPGAVELCTVYEDGKLTGLRLATKEEENGFGRDRRISSDAGMTMVLAESVCYDDGHIYFTIPESEGHWSIFIQGRVLTEDGAGQSVRYLEEESEKGEWIPRMTYSFEVGDAAFEELTMDIKYGSAHYCYPLTLLLPEGKPQAAVPLPEGKADVPEDGSLVWPVDSDQISNSFGDRAKPGGEGAAHHDGVDIGGLEKGAPVYAAAAGTVDAAGYESSVGNYVILTHGNGMITYYSHCEKLLVKTGDTVEPGQTIATVGSTGLSTGPHLHFGVQVNGESRNPLEFFTYREVARNVTGAPWAGEGYPVYAADQGRVSGVGWDEAYGYYVEITQNDSTDHRPQNVTRYSHLGAVRVKQGDKVEQGTLIANEGVDPLRVEYDVEDSVYSMRRREELTEAWLVDGDYPRNSKGQTYGPAELFWITGTQPDLERVCVREGEYGYINRDDRGERHWNPETEKWECEGCQVLANGFHYIPVYNQEGEKTGDLYRSYACG